MDRSVVTGLRPLAAPGWAAAVTQADGRCTCTGTCGSRHARTEGRCPAGTESGHRLYAAPADPTVPAEAAPAVPTAQLAAWCGPCLDSTRRAHAAPVAAVHDGPDLLDVLAQLDGSGPARPALTSVPAHAEGAGDARPRRNPRRRAA